MTTMTFKMSMVQYRNRYSAILSDHCVEFLHLVMEHRSIEKTIFPFFRNLVYSIFSTQDCYCCIGIRISYTSQYGLMLRSRAEVAS
ncbi:hypothetical protein KUA49_003575 [Segatella copri]|uniref:hypothetical protein n=1 Tax=Segatella copri TaxID=165179 RepID=UPI001C4574DB|nr:hypothetical protein [Segatella copri]WOZ85489.1 hypothetical protein KUA49_003575 [Segatella copri]